jgi:ABC-type Zn uptake system ZnuABC Zn-binding protein ZnuA
MKIKSALLAAALLLPLLSGCSQTEYAQVAATTLPVYEFTAALCEGTGISVTRLVTENVSCLHDYSLNVSQVRSAEAAELVVISGAGLDVFIEDLTVDEANIIDSSHDISLLGCEEGHDHDDHGHDHEADAHIWLSPANAKMMSENICHGLTARYPEHQQTFESNLAILNKKLDALQTYGEAQLSQLKCRELITFHDGFSYLAQAFDLTILEAIEEESGSEASAQELIHLVGLVQDHSLPAVFTETNGSVSAADIISAETGTAVYTLDMAMGQMGYFEAMKHNIDTIREALG